MSAGAPAPLPVTRTPRAIIASGCGVRAIPPEIEAALSVTNNACWWAHAFRMVVMPGIAPETRVGASRKWAPPPPVLGPTLATSEDNTAFCRSLGLVCLAFVAIMLCPVVQAGR